MTKKCTCWGEYTNLPLAVQRLHPPRPPTLHNSTLLPHKNVVLRIRTVKTWRRHSTHPFHSHDDCDVAYYGHVRYTSDVIDASSSLFLLNVCRSWSKHGFQLQLSTVLMSFCSMPYHVRICHDASKWRYVWWNVSQPWITIETADHSTNEDFL